MRRHRAETERMSPAYLPVTSRARQREQAEMLISLKPAGTGKLRRAWYRAGTDREDHGCPFAVGCREGEGSGQHDAFAVHGAGFHVVVGLHDLVQVVDPA